MIEQTGNSVTFLAQFLASGAAATGLTVTVDVYRVSDESLLVNDGAANEVGASGVYKYTYGPAATEDDYLAVFHTTGTADQVDVPSLWTIGHAGIEFLDASIAARTAGLVQRSEPPTVGAVADQVWDEALAGHAGVGSAGAALTASGSAGDPLLNPVPGAYAQGTAGFALGRVGRAAVQVTSPVSISGVMELTRGDDYSEEDGLALEFLSSSWRDLTTVTEVRLTVRRRPEAFAAGATDEVWFTVTDKAASRVTGAGAQTVIFELTPTETAELEPSLSARERYAGKYDVQATIDGRIITLAVGSVRVVEDQTR